MTEEVVNVTDNATIKNKIFIIRGQKVMLDFHLAEIYGYETKQFNRQVQRNIEKFDSDFMFRLTKDEYENLRCQFGTSSYEIDMWGGRRYLPYAFTEQGIYMLMTVLKGKLAIEQSKMLIRLFKGMKDYIVAGNNYVTYNEFNKLSLITYENAKDIKELKKNLITKRKLANVINELTDNKIKKDYLFLNGEKIEAMLAYQNIYKEAKVSIDIIDDYISLKTLVLLKDVDKNIKITIYSDNVNHSLTKMEYDDFVKEYPNIDITFKVTNKLYHDRYVFIDYNTDKEKIYHSGASSKDAGNKVTTINIVNDNIIYHPMIDNLISNRKLNL